VTSATKASSALASRYARALIELAGTDAKISKVEKDLADLRAMIAGSSDFNFFLKSPLINNDDQLAVVEAIAKKAKLQDITKNLLGVMIENERLSDLPAIIGAFDAQLAARRGEMTVSVKVAQDLSAAQKKSLTQTLEKALSAKITLDTEVQPDLLGGMVVTAGSLMVDDSVASKLKRLRYAIEHQANENEQSVSKTA